MALGTIKSNEARRAGTEMFRQVFSRSASKSCIDTET